MCSELNKNCKCDDFPEENTNLPWQLQVKKYKPHTVPKLLELKKEFNNNCLEDMSEDPDEWITELESLQVQMDTIDILSKMINHNSMIHIMNSLPEQCVPIVDNLEIRLMNKDNNQDKGWMTYMNY